VKSLRKLLNSISWLLRLWEKLGFFNALKIEILNRHLKQRVTVLLEDADIELRPNTSDLSLLKRIFIEDEYNSVFLNSVDKQITILDAGANVGFASVFFLSLFPESFVVSVEPDADNIEQLARNLRKFEDRSRILHSAVMGSQCTVAVVNSSSAACSRRVNVVEQGNNSIAGLTIDKICDEMNLQFDIVKLDIEGAERDVFTSENLWAKSVKVLIVELHDRYSTGASASLFKFLLGLNRSFEIDIVAENIFVRFDGKCAG